MTVDASMIRAILFDLDDTLHDFSHSERMAQRAFSQAQAERLGLEPAAVLDTLLASNTRALAQWFERRDFAHRTIIEYRIHALGDTLSALGKPTHDAETLQALAEAFEVERRRHARVYADTHACLRALQGRFKLGLISNGPRDSQRRNAEQAGVLEYFDTVLIEGETGLSKPESGVFHLACMRLHVKPEEALMVGDSLVNDIGGGARAGLHTVWVDRPESLASPSKAYSDRLGQGIQPDFTVASLAELVTLLAG